MDRRRNFLLEFSSPKETVFMPPMWNLRIGYSPQIRKDFRYPGACRCYSQDDLISRVDFLAQVYLNQNPMIFTVHGIDSVAINSTEGFAGRKYILFTSIL